MFSHNSNKQKGEHNKAQILKGKGDEFKAKCFKKKFKKIKERKNTKKANKEKMIVESGCASCLKSLPFLNKHLHGSI